MHETKCLLILMYGCRCMLCKREVQLHELQWHHMKPKYQSKREGFPPDNSVENGSLLCSECHKMVHRYDYNDLRYQAFMKIVAEAKKNPSE